ncbi:Hypothetical protein A7982_05594 [Minicystis rosea]|nr:Hypothetical protein A7982_05594 [Minicystis rosea]
MACWSEITIQDGTNALKGDAARAWVAKNHPKLLEGKKKDSAVIVLKLGAKYVIGANAIDYLMGLLGTKLTYAPNGATRKKSTAKNIRRELGNVLMKTPPEFVVEFEIGDTDGLMDPVNTGAPLHTQTGIKQRLQALGYLYTPLQHPMVDQHAQLCVEYYRDVVHAARGPLSDAQVATLLRLELQNNVVTDTFPAKGVICNPSRQKLPPRGTFGAIRIPGGFTFTKSSGTHLRFGDHRFSGSTLGPGAAKYDFLIGDDRFRIEDVFYADNDRLGKIPLIATVKRRWPNGELTPVPDVPVLFGFVAADPMKSAQHPVGDPGTVTPFCAPPLPDRVMNYGKDWAIWSQANNRPNQFSVHKGLNAGEWAQAHAIALQLHGAAVAAAPPGTVFTPALVQQADINRDIAAVPALQAKQAASVHVVKWILEHAPPYEITNAGQARFMRDNVDAHVADGMAATHPLRQNCPERWGGKADAALDKLFYKGPPLDGFHTKRPTQLKDYGPLSATTDPDDPGNNPYAVQCKTNEKGNAGVVFMPSRCGGDRYKLRAYIDPEWLRKKGAAATLTTSVETGTLVVWRNIRFRRYLQKQPPAPPYSPAVQAMLNHPHGHPQQQSPTYRAGDAEYDRMHMHTNVSNLDIYPGAAAEAAYNPSDRRNLPSDKKKWYRPTPITPTGLETQLKWGYCDFIADNNGIEAMSNQVLQDALNAGIAAIRASGIVTTNIDWGTLIFHDMASPFMVNWRSFVEYNDLIAGRVTAGTVAPGLYPPLSDAQDGNNFTMAGHFLVEGMMEHFAGGGCLPGLTVVQVPIGESWDGHALNHYPNITSGYGTFSRGGFLAYPDPVYRSDVFIYPATANATHELGHVLALKHQYPLPSDGDVEQHQIQTVNAWTTPAATDCVCVMSYHGCYGEFCARCILALRGWQGRSSNNMTGV